ncbi:MAG: methyltransferase domain-containing protein [Candidatus Brocadiia bacterium]
MTGVALHPPEGERAFKNWLADHARQMLRRVGVCAGCRVLDYGSGGGTFCIPAAQIAGPEGEVIAADVDKDALANLKAEARRRGLTNLRTLHVRSPSEGRLLEPGSLDVVLLYDVLQMVDERAGLLRRLRDLLRPGGTMSIFPMHVGSEELERLAAQVGGLCLSERCGLLLNYRRDERA